nr:MAG TPA: hypothetical protein [Caudoviricetes sp.]
MITRSRTLVLSYYLGLKEAYEYRHLSLGRHTIAHAQPLMFRTTIYTLRTLVLCNFGGQGIPLSILYYGYRRDLNPRGVDMTQHHSRLMLYGSHTYFDII